ncbi:MAG: RNA polymerase sigma factor [Sandaracinaceae bacterium]
MDAPANPETHLLRLLESGDVRQAAHVLVTQHADEVYGLCRAMIRNGTEAEDLSQDVFAKAFRALPKFRGEASVRTWILRITRNACIDHLRAKKREPWSTEDEPDAVPVDEPSVADLLSRRESITRALDALEENERALVVLRFGHGLGYPELADAFGLKPGTVRMRVSRALTKMRTAADEVPAPRKKLARRRSRTAPEVPASAPAPAPAAPTRLGSPPAPGAPPPMGAPPPAASPAAPLPPRAPQPSAPQPSAPTPRQAPPAPFAGSASEDDDAEQSLDLAAPRHAEDTFAEGTEEDATAPFRPDRDDEATLPFSRGAMPGGAAPKARGSGWFGWLGRLFSRDRARDTERTPTPEAPPESTFAAPPPAAFRARLDRMVEDLG